MIKNMSEKWVGLPQISGVNVKNIVETTTYIYIYMVAPPPGTYLLPFCTVFTVFKASPGKGFEGRGYPLVL